MINIGKYVKGLEDYCLTDDMQVYSLNSNKFLKVYKNKDGYLQVSLKDRNFLLHRIIAFVHCPNYQDGFCVNHKDGVKDNNDPSNLEWVSIGDNNRHAFETGLNHGNGIYQDAVIIRVCKLLQDGLRPTDISNMLDVRRELVSAIKNGGTYSYISSDFDFTNQKREVRSSVDRVIKICNYIVDGFRDCDIVRKLNIPRKTVSNIRHRKTFTAISCNYDW